MPILLTPLLAFAGSFCSTCYLVEPTNKEQGVGEASAKEK